MAKTNNVDRCIANRCCFKAAPVSAAKAKCMTPMARIASIFGDKKYVLNYQTKTIPCFQWLQLQDHEIGPEIKAYSKLRYPIELKAVFEKEICQRHPECKGLVMLQFKDRYTFLCHKQRLQEHLDSNSKCPPYFIDIQGNQPAQRDQPPHLQEWLGIKLLPFLSSDETYFFMPFVPPYMVALTGWMLEYPVIYVSHVDQDDPNVELDEWEPRTNCLGGQPLQVIGVWLHNNHSPLSKDYKLLSFSYPQDVIHSSDHRLSIETALEHKMRRRLQDQNHRPCLQSTALELEKTSTVLDRVAL
ncbi:uncharacterized protein BYT42DRAFT_549945 [Radiomyces spectabilis]|uniref:uncharacterized protein n=1 Tax=Radiomyces spectabilis TaxID=64574 RepID=UPI002220B52D|nr:uncharacterized protein BYT42DRAFT_549945 [Radiomyces spectabilis]KAI8365949.1 hypothetical protein BYT42DRAFT_549945 [Radiomyces spectabilis]